MASLIRIRDPIRMTRQPGIFAGKYTPVGIPCARVGLLAVEPGNSSASQAQDAGPCRLPRG